MIQELNVVNLVCSIETEDGLIPAGSRGTVVFVYPNENAYEVEFTHPFHTVATVETGCLRKVL